MDIPELIEYFGSAEKHYEGKLTAAKTAQEDKDKEHKEAMDKKEEEAKKAKRASEEEKEKDAVVLKAIKSAMEEKDPEKREAAIKSAMEEHDKKKDTNDASNHEDDEEKKALKAQITFLANKIKEPQLDYLKKVYQAAKTDESTLNEYMDEWKEMTPEQLDGAIKKVKPLVESMNMNSFDAEKSEPRNPFGYNAGTIPKDTKQFDASETFKKIDDMSAEEAFGGGQPGIA